MDYAKYMKWMPDRMFLAIKFRYKMGHRLHLDDPKTFSEKLQWMKLYDHDPLYVIMVDKYEAKKYVADIIGEEHIVPTYGVWDSFDEIDFDSLPDRFALKCNHDSGGNFFVKDKKEMDMEAARRKIERCLNRNYYYHNREWVYKEVKPRVLAEKYLECGENGIVDYKFFCFDGVPKYLYVSEGMNNHKTAQMCFMDMKWRPAPFTRKDYLEYKSVPPKPEHFDEMTELAEKLSAGRKFLRVDLYEVEGKVYFSELTVIPNGGFMRFYPDKYDRIVGNWLKLDTDRAGK